MNNNLISKSDLSVNKIVLAVDTPEANEFCKFLCDFGFTAYVGRDTHNHVNDVDITTADEFDCEERQFLNSIWQKYCEK